MPLNAGIVNSDSKAVCCVGRKLACKSWEEDVSSSIAINMSDSMAAGQYRQPWKLAQLRERSNALALTTHGQDSAP
jgi:hypothetical protein